VLGWQSLIAQPEDAASWAVNGLLAPMPGQATPTASRGEPTGADSNVRSLLEAALTKLEGAR